MLALYSIVFYLSLPFIFLRLYWRGIKAPAYRLRWLERLGYYKQPAVAKQSIWIHAVSVGEAEAIFPLVKQLQALYPLSTLVVTTTTPTGSARVQAVLDASVLHVYLPYDVPTAVRRFLVHFKPKLAVIVETEIWPNIISGCSANDIPLYIVNARLSEKSLRGYLKIPAFVRSILQQVTLVVAQTQMDAARFKMLGVQSHRIVVSGNIKFDAPLQDELFAKGKMIRQQLFLDRFVWLMASTHQGEEVAFLDCYRQLKKQVPELLLLVAPRHPERFLEVKQLAEQKGLQVLMRTEVQQIADFALESQHDLYVIDTLGELKMFYAAADLAFVGGSLVPIGGHNVLEAAAAKAPVVFGPYMANFSVIAQGMLSAKAALQCANAEDLADMFLLVYKDSALRADLVSNATAFLQSRQGATQRLLTILQQALAAA